MFLLWIRDPLGADFVKIDPNRALGRCMERRRRILLAGISSNEAILLAHWEKIVRSRCYDLNPIENVWDALGWQVAGRNYPPTNKNTLIRALTEEWDKLPQQLLDNVVQSMIRRVECCITLHGGHIPY
ncbi:hypothetical protein TNCV_16571 [Trichonephila clavipes]|nr:hypothetical protein TNCV_16571 [Trichonephila clavipes]